MMEAVVTAVQSSSQIITTNKSTPSLFYRPDALPVAQLQ